MTIGYQGSAQSVGDTLGSLAVTVRDWADQVLHRQAEWNKLGTAGLEAAPYSMAPADAQAVLDHINHLATVAQVYKGLVAQPAAFNFEDSVTDAWGNH